MINPVILRLTLLFLSVWSIALSGLAQDRIVHFCGQVEAWERLRHANPSIEGDQREAEAILEAWTEEYASTRGGDQDVYIIPVVFHIIHNNGPENISDAQIQSAISVLNADFRKQNSDINSVVSTFQGITADSGIEFRLARKDPNGNCTSGINRVVSTLTYDGNSAMKNLIYWPRNRYMNVWVCADAAGAAGYTQLPSNVNTSWSAPYDGIVIRHDYTGAIGTSTPTKSRTLTHEVGHWLNLHHTWGPSNDPGVASNCNTDDYVSDTPNTRGWTSCSLSGNTCSSLDNVQNYMEYSYCSRMFTQGQATRMRAALNSGVAQRSQLISTTTQNATGVLGAPVCVAQFTASLTTACAGTAIQFYDDSYHEVTYWIWNFGDGTVLEGSNPQIHKNPVHTYTQAGQFNVTLNASNSFGSAEVFLPNYISVFSDGALATPLQESFEGNWPTSAWTVINPDGGMTWEVNSAAAYTGTKSVRVRNFNTTILDETDELISATFDMSGAESIQIGYKWAYANRLIETDDRLRISISSDCGETWTFIRLRRGLTNLPTASPTNISFLPTSLSHWGEEVLVVENPQFFTGNFQVKFEMLAKGGNNLYLDDINIWKSGEVLVGVEEHTSSAGFVAYPNPAADNMNVEFSTSAQSHVAIELFDLSGRLCLRQSHGLLPPGEHRFVIPRQPVGMYLMRLQTGDAIHTKKVVFR